jgi:hypothetical protein
VHGLDEHETMHMQTWQLVVGMAVIPVVGAWLHRRQVERQTVRDAEEHLKQS